MADVYGHAALNIAASAAPDGRTGCLFARNTSYTSATIIHPHGRKQRALLLSDADVLHENITRSPLAQRAWSLQERLLAKRTIFFTASQMFWECAHAFHCESLPHGELKRYKDVGGFNNFNSWTEWPLLVRYYSRGKLTYHEDRAVAIAGIARRFSFQTSWLCCRTVAGKSPGRLMLAGEF